jgi:hypothetical protein
MNFTDKKPRKKKAAAELLTTMDEMPPGVRAIADALAKGGYVGKITITEVSRPGRRPSYTLTEERR